METTDFMNTLASRSEQALEIRAIDVCKEEFIFRNTAHKDVHRNLADIRGIYRRLRKFKPNLLKPPNRAFKALLSGHSDITSSRVEVTLHQTKKKQQIDDWLWEMQQQQRTMAAEAQRHWQEFLSEINLPNFGQRSYHTNTRDYHQYFTLSSTAEFVLDKFIRAVDTRDLANTIWIEPAAGDGALYHFFPSTKCNIGIDVDTTLVTKYNWIQADFLKATTTSLGISEMTPSSDLFIVTNPPFQHAFEFVVKALTLADNVGMILPISCERSTFFDRVQQELRPHNREIRSLENVTLEACHQKYRLHENDRIIPQPTLFQVWKARDLDAE